MNETLNENQVNEELYAMVKQADDELNKIANGIYIEALNYGIEVSTSMDKTAGIKSIIGTIGTGLSTAKDYVTKAYSEKYHKPFQEAILGRMENYNSTVRDGFKHVLSKKQKTIANVTPHIVAGTAGAAIGATAIGLAVKSLARKERLLSSAAKYLKAHRKALMYGAMGVGGLGATGAGIYAMSKQSSQRDEEYERLENYAIEKVASMYGINMQKEATDVVKSGIGESAKKLWAAVKGGTKEKYSDPVKKFVGKHLGEKSEAPLTGVKKTITEASPYAAPAAIGITGAALIARKLLKKETKLNQLKKFMKQHRTGVIAGAAGAGALGLGAVAATR
jgi:hypothetical protein